ncbi:hypothetical protein M9Y10_042465 [Tritrichomonas musculus]|uniref:Thioredoxin domain-containing protein n=1 Tax=Tritrichomonas musculus TaxID=1915356 RepID=A0ABR2GNT1_9EUKA
MILLFLILQTKLSCIERVHNSDAGMIFLTADSCRHCNYVSTLIQNIRPTLPKGSVICSKNKQNFNNFLSRKPNFDVPNFALYRKGEFIQISTENFTAQSITKTINDLLHPPVNFIDESNISLSQFYKTEKTIIFHGEEEDMEEFYRVSIYFRNYPITFLVGYGNYSAIMIDNFRKRQINYRGYPEQLVEWVSKVSDITPPYPTLGINNTAFLYLTYGAVPQETEILFNQLSYKIGEHVALGYANWDRDRLQIKPCKMSPAEGTYVAITPDGICYPFVDDDVATPELISFFMSKVVQGYYKRPTKNSSTTINFGRVVPLNAGMITKKIPSHKCAVLHISNSLSYSHMDVSKIYAKVARKFTQKSLAFYELDTQYNWAPSYVPNNDGFPMIAMWRPNDQRPYIFKEVLTSATLTNWVLAKALSFCNLTMI